MSLSCFAQERVDLGKQTDYLDAQYCPTAGDACKVDQERAHQTNIDPAKTHRLTTEIVVANIALVGLYGKTHWWKGTMSGNFRVVNEGWFGQNTYAGGADKLGHFYMNYAGTRLFARAFEWAGNDRERALTLSTWLTLGTFTAVEVIDGFSDRWHFSKEDAIINAIGAGTGLLFEKYPELDRVLDLRVLYIPSRENDKKFDPFGDYSGQTYLLVAKASGIPALRRQGLLRYLEVAVGYGSRGYSTPIVAGNDPRMRNLYVGVSLNLSELLDQTAFKDASVHRRAQALSHNFFEYVQVPGTVVLTKHSLTN